MFMNVYNYDYTASKLIQATDDLRSFKRNVEAAFKFKSCKLYRKNDAAEIDNDDTYLETLFADSDNSLYTIEVRNDYQRYGSISDLTLTKASSNYKNSHESCISKTNKKNKFLIDKELLNDDQKASNEEICRNRYSVIKSANSNVSDDDDDGINDEKKHEIKEDSLENTEYFIKVRDELMKKVIKEQKKINKYQDQLNSSKKETTETKHYINKRNMLSRRLKKIRDETEVTTRMSDTRLKQLENEIKAQKEKMPIVFAELKSAEKVDICFLVDCTGSMDEYIKETRTVIHQINKKLCKLFRNFEVRSSFVGYRDHTEGEERIVLFPFSNDANLFENFVNNVCAHGGVDQCEDVFGGLEEVTKLNWLNNCRILFHIADAPCHGKRFHVNALDDYPDGDPRGLDIKKLLKQLVDLNINYYFSEINTSTLKMIDEFNNEFLILKSKQIKSIKLANASDLVHAVEVSIMETVNDELSKNQANLKNLKIVQTAIDWSITSFKNIKANLIVATFHGSIDKIKSSSIYYEYNEISLLMSNEPFSRGSLRYAYTAILNHGTKTEPIYVNSVLKESVFIDPERNSIEFHKESVEIQVIARFLAQEFSKLVKLKKRINIIEVNLIRIEGSECCYTIEDYVEGKFMKWMNNEGEYDNEIKAEILHAFSHWTYEATNEYLIVTDLQGFMFKENEYVLTDPTITCAKDPEKFSLTNLGSKGVETFFRLHECNQICKSLNLKNRQSS